MPLLDLLNLPDAGASCEASYRADNVTGAGTASAWPDRSGNGRDITFPNEPTITSDAGADYNNQPGLTFNGSNNYGSTSSFTVSQPLWVVAIGEATLSNAGSKALFDGSTTGSGTRAVVLWSASEVVQLFDGSTIRTGTTGNSVPGSYAALFSGASSSLRVNLVEEIANSLNASAGIASGITIGASGNVANYWGGNLLELAVFSAEPTQADLAFLAQYCEQRYGFAPPFPQLSSTSTTFDSDTTTHNVNIPALEAGEGVVVALEANGAGGITTPGGGWERFDNHGSNNGGLFRYKATSDEVATTVNFATTNAVTAVARVIKVSLWSGNLAEMEASAVENVGSGTAPNPPSVTASWGSDRNTFIAIGQASDDDIAFTAAPANYTDLVSAVSGGGTNNGCSVGSAHRNLENASDDPGTFTLASSENWGANTVVIRPLLSVGPFVPTLPLLGVG